jgi:ribosomal protein S18
MEKPFENKMEGQAAFFGKMAEELNRFVSQQEKQLETLIAGLPEEQQQKIRAALSQGKKCRTLDEVNALIRSVYVNSI